jgi:transcriptional regulator with XRE-family HTH domain
MALALDLMVLYMPSGTLNAISTMPLGTKSNILMGAQVRGARALLNWSGDRLAQESGVSLQTIRRAEPNDGPLRMIRANAQALRSALEAAGIQFIPENGGGPGVRLRKTTPVKRPSKPNAEGRNRKGPSPDAAR